MGVANFSILKVHFVTLPVKGLGMKVNLHTHCLHAILTRGKERLCALQSFLIWYMMLCHATMSPSSSQKWEPYRQHLFQLCFGNIGQLQRCDAWITVEKHFLVRPCPVQRKLDTENFIVLRDTRRMSYTDSFEAD